MLASRMFAKRVTQVAGSHASAASTLVRGRFAHSSAVAEGPMSFALTEDQRALRDLARKFAREEIYPAADELDRTMEYPEEIFKKAWELGLVNGHIPEEYGGLGLSSVDGVLIGEELAAGCSGIFTAIEGNSLAETPVLIAGNDAQKKEYFGRMIAEPLQAAYCVTEPQAGSDVAGIKTKAVKNADGDYVLNGSKMWITNGGRANWYFVLAKTSDEGPLHERFSTFIVDRDLEGVSVGKKEINMGQRCSDTRAVFFEDVVVKKENVLGKIGQGFKIAMLAFNTTRPPVGAGAVGVARRALEESLKWAHERTAFGVPIIQHQAVAFKLADMATSIEAGRLLVHKAAWLNDCGVDNALVASMAKRFSSDECQRIVWDAVQIFGGAGFNTEYPVEKLYRDCRIYSIYEGTSEIQRGLIAKNIIKNPDVIYP